MKKLLAALLLLCLLLPVGGLCEEGEAAEGEDVQVEEAPPQPVYLLWDIPFDAELEIVRDILEGSKGIRTKTTIPSEGNSYVESVVGLDEYKLFERPISLRVIRNQSTGQNSANIIFNATYGDTEVKGVSSLTALTELLSPVFVDYMTLLDGVRSVYGAPTGGRIRVAQGNMAFNYPTDKDGALTMERFIAACGQFPEVYLETDYSNVCLWLRVRYSEADAKFTYNITLQYAVPSENDTLFAGYELGDFPLEVREVDLAL